MDINKQDYTPMMQQYLTIKEDYNDAIVFFRLGDFYEMFFTDAYLASKELEIQLTGRDAGAKERVPMCGVPHHSADAYIERLIEKGYKVAICEQTEEASVAKGLVNREVTRLITPGTYMDQKQSDMQYIAALGIHPTSYTVAYLDLSTGNNYMLNLPKDYNILIGELMHIAPKEIVLNTKQDFEHIERYVTNEGILVSYQHELDEEEVFQALYASLTRKEEKKTYRRLLGYITTTQKRTLMHLKPVEVLEASSYLKMDASTMRNLELTKTLRQNDTLGSLFWLIDQTSTAMGSRFLKRQLSRPLVNKDILIKRYDTVDCLNKEFITKQELKEDLKLMYDLERIVGRISYGNANAKDLIQLRRSVRALPSIYQLLRKLEDDYTTFLANKIHLLTDLYDLLDKALEDDPPLSIKEGGLFKRGYSKELDEIRDASLNLQEWLKDFESREQEKTGIKKLKVGYNRVFGYYIEVPKGQIEHVKDEFGYTRKQTLANSERYISEALKEKESLILSSSEKSVELEYQLFLELREEVSKHITSIQENATIISEVDVLVSYSIISEKYRLTRPSLNDSGEIHIEESRHPVVEHVLLDEPFIPNDIEMDRNTDILLVTGPNMSGKSTYMRQLAVCVIMAQIGSFVPAKKADIPLFDAIFTRIGAADDLVSGKSTFMVEMLDANHAIQNATKNSLILFDEIGRGTATYDGMAIAQAIIEYIHEKIQCKTLFSTHYHELTDLNQTLPKLKNIHVSADNKQGKIVFLHKIEDGPADESYGINVASLAQLPKPLIKRATAILNHLEKQHNKELDQIDLFNFDDFTEEVEEESFVEKALKEIDIDEMSPLEALNFLSDLLKKM
jgi:DNA mismatch repair protein MutS